MSKIQVTRRSFIRKTGGAIAGFPLVSFVPASVMGANDRIQIGVIGCGSRGQGAHMKEIHQYGEEVNAVITAVCDVWKQHREEAVQATLDWYGTPARGFEDYRDLLAVKEVDAITIAAPDHQHCSMIIAAAEAGKDIYCEKPLAMTLDELKNAVDAVKKANCVFQAGTQLRSYPSFTGCKKVVQDGKLGNILKCEQVRNSYRPYWHSYVRPIQESDTNWKLFLHNKALRPFDADQHTAWYGYRDFSEGAIGGFMSHFIDLVHYITGAKFPHSAVTLGGIYAWKDQRTCPDSIHTLLDYPEGFLVSYTSLFGNGSGNYTRFYGSKGSIDATEWDKPIMTGEGSEDPERIKETAPVPAVPIPQHMQNWLQCLRSRQRPNADIDAAYQHAVACILSDEAWVSNRRMVYDPEKRIIQPA